MSNGPTEEERRRKIIIDTQVADAANRGVRAVLEGKLSSSKVRQLIDLDKSYLKLVKECVGDAFEVPTPGE